MMIKLTLVANKTEMYLRADKVLTIERNSKNVLETLVVTSILGPQGPYIYQVMESVDAVAHAVSQALKTGNPETAVRIMQ